MRGLDDAQSRPSSPPGRNGCAAGASWWPLPLLWLANVRLVLETVRLETELRASRARMVSAADGERRRIERDLHDGAQQHLTSLRVKLGLVEELVGEEAGAAKALIQEIADEAELALDDLRAMVQGIYPSVLVDRGLAAACRAMARDAPVRTSIETHDVTRYDANVEAAIYFCCLEAVQNAVKHAGRLATITIELREEDAGLIFEVRDNGIGFTPRDGVCGHGLLNMLDRIGAVGGRLEIASTVGSGTFVRGTVPVPR